MSVLLALAVSKVLMQSLTKVDTTLQQITNQYTVYISIRYKFVADCIVSTVIISSSWDVKVAKTSISMRNRNTKDCLLPTSVRNRDIPAASCLRRTKTEQCQLELLSPCTVNTSSSLQLGQCSAIG